MEQALKNFIILFEEKEGSSVMVRLLDKFRHIAILHQELDKGWEPFDQSTIGKVNQKELMACITSFYRESFDFSQFATQYYQLTQCDINPIATYSVRGFKMRWLPNGSLPRRLWSLNVTKSYQKSLIRIFQEHKVTVFVLVRQDLMRWALSRYHGDGTGKPGHMQWRVANGELDPQNLDKLNVNLSRLGRIIDRCKKSHERKKHLIRQFEEANIEVIPIRYEDFVADQSSFLMQISKSLGLHSSLGEVESVVAHGGYFRKVHSEEISNFVLNHQEVLDAYGDAFLKW